jgi:hypothetical protein
VCEFHACARIPQPPTPCLGRHLFDNKHASRPIRARFREPLLYPLSYGGAAPEGSAQTRGQNQPAARLRGILAILVGHPRERCVAQPSVDEPLRERAQGRAFSSRESAVAQQLRIGREQFASSAPPVGSPPTCSTASSTSYAYATAQTQPSPTPPPRNSPTAGSSTHTRQLRTGPAASGTSPTTSSHSGDSPHHSGSSRRQPSNAPAPPLPELMGTPEAKSHRALPPRKRASPITPPRALSGGREFRA